MGDFVLLRRLRRTSLNAATRPHISRVMEMKASRVVVLEGRYASRMEEHVRHMVQCQVKLFKRGETLHC